MPAKADGHSQMLMTGLLGANEVPEGDPDGRGQFMGWVKDGQLCYRLMVNKIDAATMAHIHTAPAGANGPVAVPLEAPATGKAEGCADVDADLLAAMLASPADYYVNVHNAEYPGGAVRGQLMMHGM
ncbi:hypothetical protein AB433_05970 [Croceicoccus naphthovorans]|uniref:CHRD domain-containing protein n=2 Tax=Croceicoccus naphthovorans TaxID=1348774 RepID=A0A0G3XK74_9SPHN|nr:hypothetical protein AB433_05970 [Croceicoccus naphthovorans]